MAKPGDDSTDQGSGRCPWAVGHDYIAYHNDEWGRAVHGETALFERFSLEAFQSGLSWLTILRKREGFRRAFAGFEADAVAEFDAADVERLLADPGIVRNRSKILAVIGNARAVRQLRTSGGLDALVWSFADATSAVQPPRTPADVPVTTSAGRGAAKALRAAGFGFVGPTTAYAAMQACGLVNDHLQGCPARAAAGGRGSSVVADPRGHAVVVRTGDNGREITREEVD